MKADLSRLRIKTLLPDFFVLYPNPPAFG